MKLNTNGVAWALTLVVLSLVLMNGAYAQAPTPFAEPPIAPQSQSSDSPSAPTGHQTNLFTGTFSYSIPIRVPPARGSSAPSLSLGYSSSSGNGWCGVGWGIATGFIERNGEKGVPITRTVGGYSNSYDEAAGFVSSIGNASSRLVIAESADTFRPEIDTSFFKFTRNAVLNQWLAVDPGGTRYFFGAVDSTSDAVLRNPSSGWGSGWSGTFRWSIKKIIDDDGNETYFDYVFDENVSASGPYRQQYLAQIRYNGNSFGPLQPKQKVVFNLERDAQGQILVRPDAFSSARMGFKSLSRARLHSIESFADSMLVARYELAYDISASTGKSLLGQVTQFGNDGTSTLPVQKFTYSEMNFQFGSKQPWGGLQNQGHPTDPYWNAISSYGHGSACGQEGLALRDIRDMDRDGKPDLILLPCGGSTYDALMVQYNNGNGFEPSLRPIAVYTPDSSQRQWASPRYDDNSSSGNDVRGVFQRIDYDGDGYDDQLWRTSGMFNARMSNRGIEFPGAPSNTTLNYTFTFNNQGQSAGVWNSPEGTASGNNDSSWPDRETNIGVAAFLDMNGDGRPDFVQRKASGSDLRTWKVQLNPTPGILEGPRDWSLGSQSDTGSSWNSLSYSVATPPQTDASRTVWHPQEADIPNSSTFLTIGTEYVSASQYGMITGLDLTGILLSSGNNITFKLIHPDGTSVEATSSFHLLSADDFNGKPFNGTWTLQAKDLDLTNTTLATVSSWTIHIEFAEYNRGTSAQRTMVIDMNGDGLPDRVSAEMSTTSAPNGTNEFDAFAVELNNGAGFEPVEYWMIQSQGKTERLWTSPQGEERRDLDDEEDEELIATVLTDLVDINGDGLPDRVERNKQSPFNVMVVQINTGSGFAPERTFTGLLFPDNVSNYQSFWGAPTGRRSFEMNRTTHRLLDMDGDGLADRVMEQQGDLLARPAVDRLYVQRSIGTVPDLIQQIDNGTGGLTQVAYTPSSQFDNRETLGNTNPWSQGASGTKNLLPGIQQLVTSVTVNTGMGQALTTTYSYAGGFFDTTRRETRGFYKVTQIDPDLARTVTYFYQGGGPLGERVPPGGPIVTPSSLGEYEDTGEPGSFAKAGFPFRIELYGREDDGTEKLYKRTFHQVEVDSMGNNRFFPFVQETAEIDIEGLSPTATLNHKVTVSRMQYQPTPDGLIQRLWRVDNYGLIDPSYFDPQSYAFQDIPGDGTILETTYADNTEVQNSDIQTRVKETQLYPALGTGVPPIRLTRNFYFPGNGRLRERWSAKDIAAGLWVKESFTYDSFGNIQTTTSGEGIVSRTEYEAVFQTFPFRQIADVNDLHHETLLTVDPRSGQTTRTTEPSGLVAKAYFDAFFRPIMTAVVVGTTETWLTSGEYHPDGLSPDGLTSYNHTIFRTNQGDTSDADGSVKYEYHDGQGRVIQTRTETEDVSNRYRVTDTLYDARGNPTKTTDAYFGLGAGHVAPQPSQASTQREFDAQSRLRKIIRPDIGGGGPMGNTLIAPRDGNQLWTTVTTDPELKVRNTKVDARGRTTHVIDEGGYTTQYKWNLAGDLERITDSQSNSVVITYDSLGRKKQVVDPDQGTWTYVYDDDGRLTHQTDGVGNLIVSHYDGLGRVLQKEVFKPGLVLQSTVGYFYDVPAAVGYAVAPGQLGRIVDVEGETRFSYDLRGRLIRRTRLLSLLPGKEFTFLYQYDDASNLRVVTYPGNALEVENLYDSVGNLRTVRSLGLLQPVTYFHATGFNEAGKVVAFNDGNGVGTTLTYYPISWRLQRQQVMGPAGLVQDLEYTYDRVGNVLSVSDHKYLDAPDSSSLSNIQYDDLHRLEHYVRSGTLAGTAVPVTFTYDSIGNMLTNGDLDGGASTYAYLSPLGQPHAVTSANGKSYSYDANGNMTQRGAQTLEYDATNRLSKVTNPGVSITTFGYDGDGSRLWRDSGGTSFTLWINEIYEERMAKPYCHVMAGDRRVCTVKGGGPSAGQSGGGGTMSGTRVFHYNHQDQLRSASVVTDNAGQPIQHYVFRAFGSSNYQKSDGSFGPGYLYTDQVRDVDTGLDYYNARYYDPELGRFAQADTIVPGASDPQVLNRFSYALNNPLKYSDPSGHSAQSGAQTAKSDSQQQRYMQALYMANVKQGLYFIPNGDNTIQTLYWHEDPVMFTRGENGGLERVDWSKWGVRLPNMDVPNLVMGPRGDLYERSGSKYRRQLSSYHGQFQFADGSYTLLGSAASYVAAVGYGATDLATDAMPYVGAIKSGIDVATLFYNGGKDVVQMMGGQDATNVKWDNGLDGNVGAVDLGVKTLNGLSPHNPLPGGLTKGWGRVSGGLGVLTTGATVTSIMQDYSPPQMWKQQFPNFNW